MLLPYMLALLWDRTTQQKAVWLVFLSGDKKVELNFNIFISEIGCIHITSQKCLNYDFFYPNVIYIFFVINFFNDCLNIQIWHFLDQIFFFFLDQIHIPLFLLFSFSHFRTQTVVEAFQCISYRVWLCTVCDKFGFEFELIGHIITQNRQRGVFIAVLALFAKSAKAVKCPPFFRLLDLNKYNLPCSRAKSQAYFLC